MDLAARASARRCYRLDHVGTAPEVSPTSLVTRVRLMRGPAAVARRTGTLAAAVLAAPQVHAGPAGQPGVILEPRPGQPGVSAPGPAVVNPPGQVSPTASTPPSGAAPTTSSEHGTGGDARDDAKSELRLRRGVGRETQLIGC